MSKALRVFQCPTQQCLDCDPKYLKMRGGVGYHVIQHLAGSHNLLQSLLCTVVERAVCDPNFHQLLHKM